MRLSQSDILTANEESISEHQMAFEYLSARLDNDGFDIESILEHIQCLQIAIPSWALGAGGTRFGRFSFQGEPATIADKLDDVGILRALTHNAASISLHIPWDIPSDIQAIRQRAHDRGIYFDAVNSNTFQDQKSQTHSYKFGSLCHTDSRTRNQAIDHNIEVIDIGNQLGSESITVWLADGSSFPGQMDFRTAYKNTEASLQKIYEHLPDHWRMFIEYKPYEPYFYSMVIPDWGTSLSLATACGDKAYSLVDLGHHLPNTNVEQIVAMLMMKGKLGGFHFNDSQYGDDDLTAANINPQQLFLIFNELLNDINIDHIKRKSYQDIAFMIDASHNLKDPLEDLIQSIQNICIAFTKALLIDREALKNAQEMNDVALCQEILSSAFQSDVRPLIAEARRRKKAAIDPMHVYRKLHLRKQLIDLRGSEVVASGL